MNLVNFRDFCKLFIFGFRMFFCRVECFRGNCYIIEVYSMKKDFFENIVVVFFYLLCVWCGGVYILRYVDED